MHINYQRKNLHIHTHTHTTQRFSTWCKYFVTRTRKCRNPDSITISSKHKDVLTWYAVIWVLRDICKNIVIDDNEVAANQSLIKKIPNSGTKLYFVFVFSIYFTYFSCYQHKSVSFQRTHPMLCSKYHSSLTS